MGSEMCIRDRNKYKLHLFGGVNNILNARYGSGHDINAFGGRYYNASPERNYYLGLNVSVAGKGY